MSENKHQPWELAQMQSLPLDAKIRMTDRRIDDWYDYWDGQVYCSISGGKDSQVLAHRIKLRHPDVPLIGINTGLEYDSVRLKMKELADEIILPEMPFVEVIKKYGYPIISKEVSQTVYECQCRKLKGLPMASYRYEKMMGTLVNKKTGELSTFNTPKYKFLLEAPFLIGHKCCDYSKKKPAKLYEKRTARKPMLGLMANESRLRKQKWEKNGCNAFNLKRPTSQPLSFWTEQDVLQYIKKYNLNIAEIYGDIVYTDEDGMFYDNELFANDMKLTTTGVKRTGCVFCLFGITQDSNRLLNLKNAEPQKYDYVMRGGHFNNDGMWEPGYDENGVFGLGYKFVIDWLNEHGNLNIKY